MAETPAENPMTKLIAAAVSHAKKSNSASAATTTASPIATVPAATLKSKIHVKPIVHHDEVETAASPITAASLTSAITARTTATTAIAETVAPAPAVIETSAPVIAETPAPAIATAATTISAASIKPLASIA